jgi:hypothetical protein
VTDPVGSTSVSPSGSTVDGASRSAGLGLRPFKQFFADLFDPLRRCFWSILLVALLGWMPASVVFAVAVRSGLVVEEFVALLDPGRLAAGFNPSAAAEVVADPVSFLIWSLAGLVLYLLGQAFVSSASTCLLLGASVGRPVRLAAAFSWALRRLPRTVPALVVTLLVVASPLFGVLALVGLGAPPSLVAAGSVAAVGLVLVLAGKLSLVPASASLAPSSVPAVRPAVRGVGGRWFAVLVRVLVVSALASTAAGVVSVPLLAVGVSGGEMVLVVAVAVRVVLSLVSAAFGFASTVLVYQDLGLPTDARFGSGAVGVDEAFTAHR